MMRMVRMELVAFGQYLKQLALTMVIMTACFTAGMGSTASLAGIIFMMAMFSLTTSASHYDDQNDWAAFRLTMPVSRRDVVMGRYLFVLLGSLVCSALTVLGAVVFAGLASADLLPAGVADAVRLDADAIRAGGFTFAVCGAMGMVTASVSMPVFFKFGQTKATQWLPFIMIFLGMVPFMVVGFIGDEAMAVAQQALAFVETPEGLATLAVSACVFGLACYTVSAMISLRVYKARDL